MNTQTHHNKRQSGLVDFGAGILLIVGVIAVSAVIGAITVVKDGFPPAAAPDGWSMMNK